MNGSGGAVAGIVVGALLLLLGACSERDKIVDVDADDPEMNAAIAQARESLPRFWEVFEKRGGGEEKFALKVKITDQHGTEYFWATNIERRDKKTFGTIDNDPNIVANVKFGDRIEIPDGDIADWLYMRQGKVVGNRTVRPLFRKMPQADVERIKSMLADD